MGNLWLWLAAAAGPLAKQVLIAVGVGWVSYAAITALLNAVQAQVVANFGAMTGTTAQILGLFGFGDAVGILLGGLAARAALMAVSHLGKVTA